MKENTEKRITKEFGNYFVEESKDGFKTRRTIATASTRKLAESKMKSGVNER